MPRGLETRRFAGWGFDQQSKIPFASGACDIHRRAIGQGRRMA
jgi:hypothetical protein